MNPRAEHFSRRLFALALFAVVAPFLFPAFKTQLAFLWIFVVLALTWDLQGGQMGYNSFGNIVFFGVGMYAAVAAQIGLFFDLAAWTESGGENTFAHAPAQYFSGFALGLVVAAILPALLALALGNLILGMRGQYFAICTLGLGIAAGEIAAGVEIVGAGSGMSVPVWPDEVGGLAARDLALYFMCAALAVVSLVAMRAVHRSRFGLALNAVRDDEDKAEAMGLPAAQCKIASWTISAFFLGLAGALTGHIIGFIDPTEVAFAGATYGVWMVLMAVLGGKGTLWGPIVGAALFQFFKEFSWTYFLGWQYVMLGLLIVVAVVFFPDGVVGFWRTRREAKAEGAAS